MNKSNELLDMVIWLVLLAVALVSVWATWPLVEMIFAAFFAAF